MVADVEVVRDRLNQVRRYVHDLRRFAEISEPEFVTNVERQYAVLHALQLAIEACIEVGTHICASDGLGIPASYADTFDLLERRGILDARLGADLRAMARFRNRIVHFYWEIELPLVYEIITQRLGDFSSYLQAIERYLQDTQASPGA